MNADDLLTTFRSEVPLPDDATARRIHARATRAPRRVSRRQLAVAAVLLGAALAGGLYASLGGASSNVNPERQRIVDQAIAQVQRAFGGDRIVSATIDGSLLKVDVKADEPENSAIGPLEGVVLTHVANQQLRAAGYEGVETINVTDWGEGALSPLPAEDQLPAGACDIPAGTQLADTKAASGRVIPLLGGFCSFRLTTAHPGSFDAETILNELRTAIPAADQGGSQHRAEVFEVDDESGTPVIIAAWGGGTNEGGSVYVRPGICTPLVSPPVTLGGSKCG